MATSGIRGSVPKNLRDNFLIVVKGEKLWRFHGPLTESAWNELEKKAAAIDGPKVP